MVRWNHTRDGAQRAIHRYVALQDDAMGEGARNGIVDFRESGRRVTTSCAIVPTCVSSDLPWGVRAGPHREGTSRAWSPEDEVALSPIGLARMLCVRASDDDLRWRELDQHLLPLRESDEGPVREHGFRAGCWVAHRVVRNDSRASAGNPVLRAAIEEHNGHRGDALEAKITKSQTALTGTEEQIARLVEFVASGGQRLDYVAEKIRRLEITARTQKAELEVLRCIAKKPLRKVSPREIGTTISRLRNARPDDVEGARDRLRRWTGNVAIRFDGKQAEIEIVPDALVADVARDGAPRRLISSATRSSSACPWSTCLRGAGNRLQRPTGAPPRDRERVSTNGGPFPVELTVDAMW